VNRLTMLVSSSFWATNLLAQAPPASILKLEDTTIALPDSHARQHFKMLSKNAQKDKQSATFQLPNSSSVANSFADENIQRLDEIRVLGNAEPEDYVAPKPPPMLVFRAMLDAQRPRTLAEKLLQNCFICPEKPPLEGNVLDRFDAKKFDRPLIIPRPRGSLQ
jgi:hypothetical protein